MSKSTSIYKNTLDTFYRLLNFIYYFSFVITLKTFKINTFFFSNFN